MEADRGFDAPGTSPRCSQLAMRCGQADLIRPAHTLAGNSAKDHGQIDLHPEEEQPQPALDDGVPADFEPYFRAGGGVGARGESNRKM